MLLGGALGGTAAPLNSVGDEPQLATPAHRPVAGRSGDKAAIVLQNYSFDNGGSADPQGWIAVDTSTDHQLFTHVDNHLPPLSGAKSLWCGAVADTDDPATSDWLGSGYGNNWDQSWVSRAFTATSPDSMILSCQIQWDLDHLDDGYDNLELEYRIDGGSWVTGTITFYYSGTETIRIPTLVTLGSTIEYRFVFTSDASGSNADGTFSSLGGFLLDDLVVQSGLGNILSSENFESELIGATATLSGDWHAEGEPGFGLYADMFPGSMVRQDDPTTHNFSHFWTFFAGSPDIYNCNEPWTAVPTGGVAANEVLSNEIRSPWVPLDPEAIGGNVRIDYDVYMDSPFPADASVYHSVKILCRDAAGQFLESQETEFFYGTQASWIPMSRQFFIPPGTAEIQTIFRVREIIDSPCHRHAPLIDNVVISQTDALTVIAIITTLPGSLHWAIEQANANPGPDVIEFDLESGNTVFLSTVLPPITETVHINGFSAPGSQPNTLIGSNDAEIKILLQKLYTDAAPALDIQTDDCVIEGLAFNDFSYGDIRIAGNDNTVKGCWLGSFPDGSYMSSIGSPRISLSHPGTGLPAFTGNTIGGPDPADHNVIGNSTASAIEANGHDALTIRGNLIGLKPDGQTAAGADHGIRLIDCDEASIWYNVISGNARSSFSSGIRINLGGGGHNIRGNIIGLSGNQLQAVPNGYAGINHQGSYGSTLIGGSYPEHGNVIAGNGGPGIFLADGGSIGITYNSIGTNAAGYATHLGNGGPGITMSYALDLVVEIGDLYGANVIAYNDGAGIEVGEYMTESFFFHTNSIHHNGGPEIDFSLWAGTPVPTPVLTQANLNGLSVIVLGYLDGDPNSEYILDLYADSWCADPADPHARRYLGGTFVNTDASGHGEIYGEPYGAAYPGDVVTAIASRWLDYGSSAISGCVQSINTPAGSDVAVAMPIEEGDTTPVSAVFDLVTTAGSTSVIYADDCEDAPEGYQIVGYYEVETTAEFAQNVTFCFDYDDQGIPAGSEAGMKVLQGNYGVEMPFLDITGDHDPVNDTICGVLSSLEPYPGDCLAIVAPLGTTWAPDTPVRTFNLLPNVPNPFNPSTTISFELPRDSDMVRVDIYDISGRRIRRLHSGSLPAGRTDLIWNGHTDTGRQAVSGVYLLQVVNGVEKRSQRLLLLK